MYLVHIQTNTARIKASIYFRYIKEKILYLSHHYRCMLQFHIQLGTTKKADTNILD